MQTGDARHGRGSDASLGRVLWIVFGCFVCQLALGYGYVFGPLLTAITADLGLTRAEFSASRIPSNATMALAAPLVGALALRFGSRAVLVATVCIMAAASVWFSRAETLSHLYVGFAMHGLITVGLGDIVVGGVISQWLRKGRGLALGLAYTGSNVGAFAFVGLATHVTAEHSWREAFLAFGLGGALLILPFAALVVRDRAAGARLDEADAAEATTGDAAASLDVRQALRTRSFWILLFGLMVFFFYLIAVIDHFVANLESTGMDNATASQYYRYAILAGLGSKVVMGIFADSLSGRVAFLLNQLLLALSSALLVMLEAPGAVVAFVALFGFSYAARDVVYPLMIAECFGVKYLAPIYGAMMTVMLPAFGGGVFVGWVYDTTGSYDGGYAVFAVLNVLVLLSFFGLRREAAPASPYTAAP